MKYSLSLIAALAALAAGPALAGSLQEPAPEPVVAVPPPAPAVPSWTGFYLGSEVGYIDVDSNFAAISGDDPIAGFTAGYDYDFGQWVVGAALDYDWTTTDLFPGFQLENIFRTKVRGGIKFGRGLAYATGGYAQAETDALGSDDGYFAGAGFDYLVSDHLSIGGEVLYHEFDNFSGTVLDLEATTVAVRTVYRF